MLFNSYQFLIFFPIVVLIYFIIPKRVRYIWLLVVSYYFYMNWNVKYVLLLIVSTVITYLSGILLDCINRKVQEEKRKKNLKRWCVFGSFFINLGILFIFKYLGFTIANINYAMSFLHIPMYWQTFDILLPVGISFYTFQALSYTMDVYRNEINAEHNIFKYALFVSFFPQLVAGPIERSKNLLTQINDISTIRLWDYDRVQSGFTLIMWGLFQKIVIADRAAIIVDYIYQNYEIMGFREICIAAVLFSFQIYCDFGGYSNIAIGAAQIMGVKLSTNFIQPFLAVNIKDFWRRWHISLTTWFTDYLYIPLGGNRKGNLRKYINIMIVFFTSGLWHGASWHYIGWGVIHGIYQIIGDIISPKENKRQSKRMNSMLYIVKVAGTFILVTFAFMLFRLEKPMQVFTHMFTVFKGQSVFRLGVDKIDMVIILFALLILGVVDLLHEKRIKIREYLFSTNWIIRCLLYSLLIGSIMFFGIYGEGYDISQFIYFQF